MARTTREVAKLHDTTHLKPSICFILILLQSHSQPAYLLPLSTHSSLDLPRLKSVCDEREEVNRWISRQRKGRNGTAPDRTEQNSNLAGEGSQVIAFWKNLQLACVLAYLHLLLLSIIYHSSSDVKE